MELIDKDALIVEIKKWIELLTNEKNQEGASKIDKLSLGGRIAELQEVKAFLDTLEVKEVDLNLEITLWANAIPEIRLDDVERLARYFFNLGLKAKGAEGICKISETNCPNFDEAQGTPITK